MPALSQLGDDARQRQIAAYRAMTPEERLRLVDAMIDDVRAIAKAGRLARVSGRRSGFTDAARSSRQR